MLSLQTSSRRKRDQDEQQQQQLNRNSNVDASVSGKELVELLVEYCTVLTHHYVFVRRVYPQRFSEVVSAYGVPVYKSTQALLTTYVQTVFQNARDPMLSGVVARICLVLYAHEHGPKLESLCINVGTLLASQPYPCAAHLRNFFRETLLLLHTKCSDDLQSKEPFFQVEFVCSRAPQADHADWVYVEGDAGVAGAVIDPVRSAGTKEAKGLEVFLKRYDKEEQHDW